MKQFILRMLTKSQSPVLRKIDDLHSIIALNNEEILIRLNELESAVIRPGVLECYRNEVGYYIGKVQSPLGSSICRPMDLYDTKWMQTQKELGALIRNEPSLHRKTWEHIYIIQALLERNALQGGKQGLGFAVGQEPLTAFFVKKGCKIVASDLASEREETQDWKKTGQHADGLLSLYKPTICSKESLFKNAEFIPVDMNNIPASLTGYDFCWSSCAFEHLGSIEKGKQFIYNMMSCLKPGGIAVHTTEVNLSSNKDTISNGTSVIFRRADIEEMVQTLEQKGHTVAPLDFRLDGSYYDNIISYHPYNSLPHFKIFIDGFLTTSMGLIIQKKR